MSQSAPKLCTLDWSKTYRLIPSRYPPIDLFERIADPRDWETIAYIEGLTNDRLRAEVGNIALLPVDERLAGPGASPIIAAFTHIGFPSRFTDGTFGVYYASNSFNGALFEVLYHKTRFLRNTAEPKTPFDFREYVGQVHAQLHDVRNDDVRNDDVRNDDVRNGWNQVHDPESYEYSQALAKKLRNAQNYGIVFRSIRCTGAENIAIFRPSILSAPQGKPHVIQGSHVRVEWDGNKMSRYIVMGEASWKAL